MSFQKNPTTTSGDLMYASTTSTPATLSRFAPNSTSTPKLLTQTSSTLSWVDHTTMVFGAGGIIGATAFGSSGKIGEYVCSFIPSASAINISTSGATNLTSLQLPGDGIYKFTYMVCRKLNGSTFNSTTILYFSNQTASASGIIAGLNSPVYNASYLNNSTQACYASGPIIGRLNGSTLTFADNSSSVTLTSRIIYINHLNGSYTGGPPSIYGYFMYMRIG